MNFDLILANPPYGKIGANITSKIIKEINFKEYVNLMPLNDYKRSDTIDLFKYASEFEAFDKAFGQDAFVRTHVAKISNVCNNISIEEFEINNYLYRELDKYFIENNKRNHNAIDNSKYKPDLNYFKTLDISKILYLNKRVVCNKHLNYDNTTIEYLVNSNNITVTCVLENSAKSEQALGHAGDFSIIEFESDIEKINICKFIYSELGFRFISFILTSINKDSYYNPKYYIPKVDWTKEWTLSDLLLDYGYNNIEIKSMIEYLYTNYTYQN